MATENETDIRERLEQALSTSGRDLDRLAKVLEVCFQGRKWDAESIKDLLRRAEIHRMNFRDSEEAGAADTGEEDLRAMLEGKHEPEEIERIVERVLGRKQGMDEPPFRGAPEPGAAMDAASARRLAQRVAAFEKTHDLPPSAGVVNAQVPAVDAWRVPRDARGRRAQQPSAEAVAAFERRHGLGEPAA